MIIDNIVLNIINSTNKFVHDMNQHKDVTRKLLSIRFVRNFDSSKWHIYVTQRIQWHTQASS